MGGGRGRGYRLTRESGGRPREAAAARPSGPAVLVRCPGCRCFGSTSRGGRRRACADHGKAIQQEAIKQVAIGHRVTQSMPQSFTERKQMALRARRFDQCTCHQREAPKSSYLLSVLLSPMATCLIASWRACCQGHPRYGTNSQPNERTTHTTAVDSFVIGHRLTLDAGLKHALSTSATASSASVWRCGRRL
jgi:hypothetical protein